MTLRYHGSIQDPAQDALTQPEVSGAAHMLPTILGRIDAPAPTAHLAGLTLLAGDLGYL